MSELPKRPNILVILTDQQRFPTPYEPDGLRQWRHDEFAAERTLRDTGVTFTKHYAMAAACAPSRASLLTGQYPSLHGVTPDRRAGEGRRQRRHVLAVAGHGPDDGRLVSRRGLPDLLQGEVARRARGAPRSQRRGLSALDRRRWQPQRGEHRRVSEGRPASMSTASLSGSGPSRTGWASTTPECSRTSSRRTRRSRCCSGSTATKASSRG